MNVDQLIRESLERTASAQPVPDGLHGRSVACARRLRSRRRTAGAVASAGVVAVGAVGGWAALPGHTAARQVSVQATEPETLSDTLARMALAPDTTATATAWFQRETTTQREQANPTARAYTAQTTTELWLARDGSSRSDNPLDADPAGSRSVIAAPTTVTWAQAHALPTEPRALAAALALVMTPEPAVASLSPGTVNAEAEERAEQEAAELDLLASGPGAPPAVRAAAIELLSQTPGVQVELDAVDATGRTGLSIQLLRWGQGGQLERWIFDAHSGQELQYQALSPKDGSVYYQSVVDVSAPVASMTALPAGVGVMLQPTPVDTQPPAGPSATAVASRSSH